MCSVYVRLRFFGFCWVELVVFGCFWLFLVVFGCFLLFFVVFCCVVLWLGVRWVFGCGCCGLSLAEWGAGVVFGVWFGMCICVVLFDDKVYLFLR
jgi:hypothetical protein